LFGGNTKTSNNNNSGIPSYNSVVADSAPMIQWSWCDDENIWIDYVDDVNLKIETAFRSKEPTVKVDNQRY
jgi:hypothetical protein